MFSIVTMIQRKNRKIQSIMNKKNFSKQIKYKFNLLMLLHYRQKAF